MTKLSKITLEDKALVVIVKRDGQPGVLIPPGSPYTGKTAGEFLIALGERLVRESTPSDTPSNSLPVDIKTKKV